VSSPEAGSPRSASGIFRAPLLVRVLYGLTVTLFACYAVYTLTHFGGAWERSFFLKWVNDAVMLLAAAVCFARAVLVREKRLAWLLIGWGVLVWGIGNIYYSLYVINLDPLPIPSVADFLWLAMYPSIFAGVVLLMRSNRAHYRAGVWLDGAVAGLSICALSAALVLGAVLNGSAGESSSAVVTNVAYPVGDMLVLGVIAAALGLRRWRPDRMWGALAVAGVAIAVTDGLFLVTTARGSYEVGTIVDAGWLLTGVLVAAAAWQPSSGRVEKDEDATGSRLAIPALLGIYSLGLLVWDHFDRTNTIALVLASTAVLTVIARMVITFGDNLRLLARVRHLIAALPAVTYVRDLDADTDARFSFMSPQIERLTGIPAERWLEESSLWLGLVHPEDRTRVLDDVEQARSAGQSFESEYRMLLEDGRTIWVHDRSEPGRGLAGDGGDEHLQGFIVDVTERREAERARDRLETELLMAQKLEAVGQLAAGIAHEINTPIQYVGDSIHYLDDSFAELLGLLATYRSALDGLEPAALQAIADAEEAADVAYVTERVPAVFLRVYSGVERVSTLVRSMKSFAHTSPTEKQLVDLNEALETTLEVARNEYKYVATLEVALGEIPHVACNRSELNQVFLNLVVNAAQAIEDAGRGDHELGTIRIETRCDGDDVSISIADDGCGIPEEIRGRIFEPFFTTKEVGRGSGQGLAIARSMIERNGGTLGCESEVGVGTTITIRLSAGAADGSGRLAA
jgi:PAS domain S-box-containing protein